MASDGGVHMTPHRPSRPAIGFPVGTVTPLLLVLLFFVGGITISCCFQRGRRPRSLRRRSQQLDDDGHSTTPPKNDLLNKDLHVQSIPVIMPGEQIPTYMAWPCPCKAPSLPSPLPSPPTRIDVGIDIPTACSPPSTLTNSTPTTPSHLHPFI